MAEQTHTPGPWKLWTLPECGAFEVTAQIGDCESALICSRNDLPKDFAAEGVANAHLIAAAPEMYGVLKMMADSLECCLVCGCWPHTSMCALVDAIAKAEGR